MENESGTFELGEVTVHRPGFGAMRPADEDHLGPPEDVDEARRVLDRAVALGVDRYDTASQ